MKTKKIITFITIFWAGLLIFSPITGWADANELPAIKADFYVNPNAKKYAFRKVVLLPFVYHTLVMPSKANIEKLLLQEIENINKYSFVTEKEVSDWLKKEKIEKAQLVRYPMAVKIAKALFADAVITGSVSSFRDNKYSFNARFISAENEEVMWSFSTQNEEKGTTVDLIRTTVRELHKKWLKAGDILATGMILPPIEAFESFKQVKFTWKPSPSKGVKEYILYKSVTNKIGSFKPIAKLNPNGQGLVEYIDKRLQLNKPCYYRYRIATTDKFITLPCSTVKATINPLPRVPNKLKATTGLLKRIELNWTANKEPEIQGYRLYRSRTPDTEYKPIKVFSKDELSYTDKDVSDGVLYYYKLSAYYTRKNEGPKSDYIIASSKTNPHVPRDFKAASGEVQKVTLSWQPNKEPDIKRYILWGREEQSKEFEKIASVDPELTEYVHKGLKHGTTYNYKLRALDSDDLMSDFTISVMAITKPLPHKVVHLTAQGENGKIKLVWLPGTGPEADTLKYEIYRDGWFGSKKIATVTSLVYVDKDVDPGDKHEYYVIAVDKDGLESKKSEIVSATAQ